MTKQLAFLFADGAHDVHSHLDLSGEPLIPDLQDAFKLRPPIPLAEYQDLTLEGLDYECAYSDYWNSTAAADGQIVDAVIMPVAPHAAVIPGKYYHTGGCFCSSELGMRQSGQNDAEAPHLPAYTEVINLMNYSAAVIPVTKADKAIDVVDNSYRPLSADDKLNWEACMFSLCVLYPSSSSLLTYIRRSRDLPRRASGCAARRAQVRGRKDSCHCRHRHISITDVPQPGKLCGERQYQLGWVLWGCFCWKEPRHCIAGCRSWSSRASYQGLR